ncbi:MAG: hypothetical protein DRQ40_05360 [Gammaproteobacteria bacterium]|nr:MAG: hypothetical protein DRQ40_05360 [Gammaproteobacteria bacterium]
MTDDPLKKIRERWSEASGWPAGRLWEHPGFEEGGDPWDTINAHSEEDYEALAHSYEDMSAILQHVDKLETIVAAAEAYVKQPGKGKRGIVVAMAKTRGVTIQDIYKWASEDD